LDGIIENKRRLRQSSQAVLKTFDAACFTAAGRAAAALLPTLPRWEAYRTVLAFCSMNGEIDTAPLMTAAREAGKEVFVPRVEGDDLHFFKISAADDLTRGAYGIREPAGGSAFTARRSADAQTLVLCPGLAFDRAGGRLGRGRGCYDRFLAGLARTGAGFTGAGLCLHRQLLDRLPLEEHDRRMDYLLTEEELIPV
jgi:5-formyltetrahydrofolate cyclo-ligase